MQRNNQIPIFSPMVYTIDLKRGLIKSATPQNELPGWLVGGRTELPVPSGSNVYCPVIVVVSWRRPPAFITTGHFSPVPAPPPEPKRSGRPASSELIVFIGGMVDCLGKIGCFSYRLSIVVLGQKTP